MSCLAHVFEEDDALGQLERFASLNGPAYYGLDANHDKLILVKSSTPVDYPVNIETRDGNVTVFDPGFPLYWRIV